MHDREILVRAYLAKKHRTFPIRLFEQIICTLIYRFDSRKPSVSNGNVSALQFNVFCNNSV